MANIHQSVFAEYQRSKDVELEFSEENPTTKYEFGDEIGRGAFAVIKRCHRLDDKNKKLMAAKFVKYTDEDGEEDPETLKILKREVAMIQKWEHEKFIILLEVYIVRKYVVLIMEWVDGKNLLPYLIAKQEAADKARSKPKLSEKDIALLTKQLLMALQYLHQQGIAYLDIKPDNIMVQSNGNIKLVDYDNCRHIVSKQGDVVDCIGTPEFTAPEALVYENCSQATDMWSLGVLIHVMMTAKSPFADPDENEVLKKVAKVKYEMADFGRCTPYPKNIIEGVFKRIPEKRLTLDAVLAHEWFKKNNIQMMQRNMIPATTADFIQIKETLDSLESEEPVFASCVLRSFKEDPYDTPDEDDEDEE
ncbi:death-associated protein kinase 2-like [Dendronephthya gigantea]|uniref:death-associated protein kinase 2-like n=1 Tax=Dendronephthya gigantea TaxID=151771 RepID=UPI00106D1105|nr:death-associated protein kinase 2-like [Dendronephthya gigantea]